MDVGLALGANYNVSVMVNSNPLPGATRGNNADNVVLQSANVITDLPANAQIYLLYETAGLFLEVKSVSPNRSPLVMELSSMT